VLANAIRWAAQKDPDIKVTAPLCVLAGFLTKRVDGKQQTIVHLLNGVNTSTGHSSAADKQFGLREEQLPLADVKVVFKGPRPQTVRLVPEKTVLEPKQVDGGWEVVVPKLTLHSVVVAEYPAP
jgi:hypothetical protein